MNHLTSRFKFAVINMFLYLNIIDNPLKKEIKMKAFCQTPGCNRETEGDSCYCCRINICSKHRYFIPFLSNTENFQTVNYVIWCWRNFRSIDVIIGLKDDFQDPSNRAPSLVGASQAPATYATYRNFYEYVMARVKLPSMQEFGNALCEKCLAKSMCLLIADLDRDFIPVLRTAKRTGLICQIHDDCLLDIVSHQGFLCRCKYCGRYGCYLHTARCNECGLISCVDHFYGGGCIAKHREHDIYFFHSIG